MYMLCFYCCFAYVKKKELAFTLYYARMIYYFYFVTQIFIYIHTHAFK